MSTNVTLNGTTYAIPALGDSNWGTVVSSYLAALSTGVLSKSGGAFTLTAEADFGATYGLKSSYFKSRATNPASAGQVRLGNTESVSWRNAANGADLSLSVNASNALQFNSANVLTAGTGLIVNADISASAAIALSKLAAVTASRALVSDGSGFMSAATTTATEIGYVSGVTSAIQTQIDGKEPTITTLAVSKGGTNSGTALNNNRVMKSSGGAIVEAAAITASRALVSDSNGIPVASTVTTTEIQRLSGVGSAVSGNSDSATLTNKTLQDVNLTGNHTIPGSSSGVITLKPPANVTDYNWNWPATVGTSGQVLTSNGGGSSAMTWSTPLTNPMNTAGDLIYGGASGTPTRLANGSSGQALLSAGGTSAPVWTTTKVTFQGYKTSSSSALSAATDTIVTFPNVGVDTASGINGSFNRYTIQVAGDYLVCANLSFSFGASTTVVQLKIFKNGSIYSMPSVDKGASGDLISCNASLIIPGLVATDYIEIYARADAGSATVVYGDSFKNTSLSIMKV